MTSPANRRRFLSTTAGAATLAAVAAAGVHSSLEAADERQKTVVGLIGPGGMGSSHLSLLARNPEVELAYVCDVDSNRLAAAVANAQKGSGKAPQGVKDMRQVFDDKRVEAVWIATPDHWHAPATILALNAGKHVYVEKPGSHNIREGRLMIEAAEKAKKVVQVGTQSRSTPTVMEAIEKIRSGAIGQVLVAKAWNSQKRGSIGKAKPSDPPAHLDYDLWLGPVPARQFQANFLPGIWRWWYDFGAGDIGNDGVHDIDVALWGLGVDTHPNRVAALGGKCFFDDDQQWPDTQYAAFEYAGDGSPGSRRQLIFEQRIWSPYVQEGYENGVAWYGTNGLLICGHSVGWKLYGPKNKLIEEKTGSPDLGAHHRNFLECMRTGKAPNADVRIHHPVASLCHLANIATRLGRTLNFDPKTEQFLGDAEASALVARKYREHWATPKGV